MHELLERITRIPQVRACTVVDVVSGAGALVSWLREGGDTLALEAAAADVFEVMSDLLPENPDSPSVAIAFDGGGRLLARRYGSHFAVVICDGDADLVTVRVALQGLALKISLHQRALSLSESGRPSRSSISEASPKSVRSPESVPRAPASRSSQSSIDTGRASAASSPPSSARDSGRPGNRASQPNTQPSNKPGSTINAFKMREDLIRLFAGQLGPLATLLVDEQIAEQGGLQDVSAVVAVSEELLKHVKHEDSRSRVRIEVERLLKLAPAASVRPPPTPADPAPYRSMPEQVDDRKIAALAKLFIEYVGPIGRLVFDEELSAARTGSLLLRPQARSLLQSLAQHVSTSGRRPFLEKAEKLFL